MKTIVIFALLAQAAVAQTSDKYVWVEPGGTITRDCTSIDLHTGIGVKKADFIIGVKAEEERGAKTASPLARPQGQLALKIGGPRYAELHAIGDQRGNSPPFIFIAPQYSGKHVISCTTKDPITGKINKPTLIHIRVGFAPGKPE